MVKKESARAVHSVTKTLASGEVVKYHYAWRGGPRVTDASSGKPLEPGPKQFAVGERGVPKQAKRER